MNRRGFIAALAMMACAGTAKAAPGHAHYPEARPFDPKADAAAAVDAALARARANKRLVLFVMGSNWCHDSRALSGWFATPRFAEMLRARYEVVYVDVGVRDRNLDTVRRFGFRSLKGTPLVVIADGAGQVLNRKEAPRWKNAASRSEDAIYRAFAEFTGA